jgi:hypothetical protein
MTIAVWIVSGLLALANLGVAGLKLFRSKESLATQMGWVNDYTGTQVKLIAVLEVLGAIGVILPPLTGILPWLAIVAAAGLIVLQIVAISVHIRRKENQLGLNFVLIALAVAVIVLRLLGA